MRSLIRQYIVGQSPRPKVELAVSKKAPKTCKKNELPHRQHRIVKQIEQERTAEIQQVNPENLPRVAADPHSAKQTDVLAVQKVLGNRAATRLIQTRPSADVQRVIADETGMVPKSVVPLLGGEGLDSGRAMVSPFPAFHLPHIPALQRQMEDGGKVGEAPVEGVPIEEEAKVANLVEGEVNEWDEQEGHLTSDVLPHVFVNGGKTGSALDNTVGGRGGTGNQAVAAIDLIAPHYESRAPASGAQAKAWIRTGTGTARVTRSYTGSLVGANGPTLYMTASAVTRTDDHEVLHVNSSRSIHDTHIVPLEARIAHHTGEANALVSGATAAEAERALQTFINWNPTIDAFRAADTAANTPMGTVDVADLASPTFIRDYGPRTVRGVNYAHYFDTPPGPRP
jgi:hypothetical protein